MALELEQSHCSNLESDLEHLITLLQETQKTPDFSETLVN